MQLELETRMDQAYPESAKLSKEEPLPNGASTIRKMLPTATKEEEDRQCREAPRPRERKKLPELMDSVHGGY